MERCVPKNSPVRMWAIVNESLVKNTLRDAVR